MHEKCSYIFINLQIEIRFSISHKQQHWIIGNKFATNTAVSGFPRIPSPLNGSNGGKGESPVDTTAKELYAGRTPGAGGVMRATHAERIESRWDYCVRSTSLK